MGKDDLMGAWLAEAARPGGSEASIEINERFWAKIPEPKLKQKVTFHVLTALVMAYYRLGQYDQAREWSNLLDAFDFKATGRPDSGQKDLVIGNVYYALGDQTEAFRRWRLADRLSQGRCFSAKFAEGVKEIYVKLAKGEKPVSPPPSAGKLADERPAPAEPSMDLDDELHEKITDLSEKGNDQMDDGAFDAAIKTFTAALDLVPEPKHRYDAAGWLWSSIGDAYYEKRDHERAASYFGLAHGLAEMLDNPFVLLRLGQCALETGDEKKAVDFLLRAYMVDGKKIFKDEKKYLDFLASKVDLGRGTKVPAAATKKRAGKTSADKRRKKTKR